MTESELDDYEKNRTLYQVFFDWLLEVFQYGILWTIIVWYVLNPSGLGWIICIGLFRWLIMDHIKDIKKSIKG